MATLTNQDLTGLGRLHIPDPRDCDHLLKKATVPRTLTSRTWYTPGPLDQGATSQCVAYSAVKYLESSPVINRWANSGYINIEALYKEAQRNDEWPGEDYDGTSVRAVAKVLKDKGYISKYEWAFNLAPVTAHLLTNGPVMVGTNWYMEMSVPDRWGYIAPLGENVGGHAWLLIGVNTTRVNPDGTKGAVRMINSWGPNWGQKGRAWVALHHMERLIGEDGEACVATEVKR